LHEDSELLSLGVRQFCSLVQLKTDIARKEKMKNKVYFSFGWVSQSAVSRAVQLGRQLEVGARTRNEPLPATPAFPIS